MIIGKEKWGSKAWHLLHIFSINNNKKIPDNKKHNYYIFYTTFSYILPCLICSDHYNDFVMNKKTLIEEKITKNYLKKWVFDIHNHINKMLYKKIYDYDIYCKECNDINNKDIFFFIDVVYKNFDYKMMSLYKFDNIYNFFKNFCILYPRMKIRNNLKYLLKITDFKKINTPIQFKEWYIKNNDSIKKIIDM